MNDNIRGRNQSRECKAPEYHGEARTEGASALISFDGKTRAGCDNRCMTRFVNESSAEGATRSSLEGETSE